VPKPPPKVAATKMLFRDGRFPGPSRFRTGRTDHRRQADNPGAILQTAKVRLLSATDERRYLSAGTSRNSSKQAKGGRIESSEAVHAPTVHIAHHSWQRGYQDMQTRPAMRAARGSLR
jgi:hypothetical protein